MHTKVMIRIAAILLSVIGVGILIWWLYTHKQPLRMPINGEQSNCIQVITPARNPQTGETKEFPTPCEVPAGWEQVDSSTP